MSTAAARVLNRIRMDSMAFMDFNHYAAKEFTLLLAVLLPLLTFFIVFIRATIAIIIGFPFWLNA